MLQRGKKESVLESAASRQWRASGCRLTDRAGYGFAKWFIYGLCIGLYKDKNREYFANLQFVQTVIGSVDGKTVLTVDVFSKDFHTFVLYLELIEL